MSSLKGMFESSMVELEIGIFYSKSILPPSIWTSYHNYLCPLPLNHFFCLKLFSRGNDVWFRTQAILEYVNSVLKHIYFKHSRQEGLYLLLFEFSIRSTNTHCIWTNFSILKFSPTVTINDLGHSLFWNFSIVYSNIRKFK